MKLRRAVQGDYPILIDLLSQLNPEDPHQPEVTENVFAEILASEYFQVIVAEYDEALVAACYLNIIPNLTRAGRPYGLIENVVTGKRFRQRGFGKKVLEHALSLAWQADCYKVMLMSGRSDASVHHFYRSCGFNPNAKQAYIVRKPDPVA